MTNFKTACNTMRTLLLLFVMATCLVNTQSRAQGYCPPTISCTSAAITSVNLNGTTNTSGTVGGYTNYASPTFGITAAQSYTLTVNGTIGFAGTYILNAWIDYDISGDWNGAISENIEIAPPQGYALGNFTKSVNFSVPATATTGNSRLRLQLRFIVGGGAANACQTGFCGEVEDYPISIQPLPPLCSSASSNSSNVYISRTDVNGTTTFSGPSTSSSFSPNPALTLFPQTTYFAFVDVTNPTNTPQNVYVYGWLDVNGNNTFATSGSEQIVLTPSAVTVPALGSVTVSKAFSFGSPFSAQNTKLRFNVSLASSGIPSPCQTGFTGEVENYDVVLHTDYCTNGADPTTIGTSSIVFNGTTYPVACCSNYSDNTSTVIPILPGQTYPFSQITYGGPTVAAVYIDYNQNGIFTDAGEAVTLTGPGTFSGNIVVPANATVGNTRMRVVSRFTVGGGTAADCGLNGVFGTVADFTVSTIALSPPSISCTGDVTVFQDPGVCSAVVVYPTPTCSANCNGGTISLISGLPSGSTFPLGTTQVHYRITTLGGTDDCFFNVIVKMSPTPVISPVASGICQGSSISVNSFSSYQWSTGATSQSIIPSASGTYTVTVTNSSGCSGTVSKAVTLNSLPAPTITGTTTICTGSSTTLSTGAFAGYSWSNGQTTQSVNVNTAGPFVVTVTDGNGCIGTSSPVSVTINTLSAAPTSISGNTIVCAGTSTTLSQVGGVLGTGASYQWFSGSCNGSFVGSGPSVTVSPSVTTTYFVLAQGICNTSSCASVTVTVNTFSIAPASISGNTTICAGGNTTLTQFGGTLGTNADYGWYSGSCGGTFLGNGPSVTVSPSVTTTYFVRASGECNTTNCASVTVNVNDASTAPTSISGNTAICSGSSTTLTQVGGLLGTGANYQWYSGSCGGTFEGSGPSLTVSPSGTTTYFVRAEGTCNTTLCTSVTVTVNPATAVPTSAITDAPFNNICLGNSVNLTVNGSALTPGVNWQWYSGSCGGTPVGSGSTINVSPTVNTTYYVRSEGGCVNSGCVSVTIAVNSTPVTSLAIMPFTGMPASVCNGTTANLSIAPVTKASYYVWDAPAGSYFNNNPLNVSPFTSAAPNVTVTFGNPSGSLYNVGVQAGNACGASIRQSQKVRGLLSVPASISGPQTACAGTTVTYSTAAVAGAVSYLWTVTGNATVSGIGSTVSITFNAGWTGGTLCVAAQTNCYTSPAKCITISTSAATLSSLTGATTACPNSVLPYSILPSSGASGYSWTTPSGSSVTNGQNTSNVSVTYASGYNASGNICVSVTSTCGVTSAKKCKTVSPGLPSQPSSISGPLTGLCGQTVVYSCPSQGAGVTYAWTVPAGATLNSGQGSSSISVTFGNFTTGSLCVKASNACGNSSTRCITLKGAPNAPLSITATPSSWCANTSGITFNANTSALTGSYTLSWLLPPASVAGYVIGGGNSSSVTLDWLTGSAAINVTALNTCGSATKTSTWSNTCRQSAVASSGNISVSPNPTTGLLNVSYNAISGKTHIAVSDLSGRTVLTQSVNSEDGNNLALIDLSNMAKGAYILTVKTPQSSQQVKIVVQ